MTRSHTTPQAERTLATLYARVSSKEQEREGYSIPAQLKLLRDYALHHDLTLAREFVDVETAKQAGRGSFGEMLKFLARERACRVLLPAGHDPNSFFVSGGDAHQFRSLLEHSHEVPNHPPAE